MPLAQQRALLARLVGECLLAWSMIEFELHEMFVSQLCFRSHNKRKYSVARFVWGAVISFEARIDMVDASIRGNLWGDKSRRAKNHASDWRLIKNYIIKLSKLRNEIAHGTIANFDNQEMKISPYFTVMPPRPPIPIGEVADRIKMFAELKKTLDWLSLYYAPRMRRETRRALSANMTTPDLVRKLRDQAAQSRGQKKKPRRPSRPTRKSRR